ncbi:50S ribosomal protein L30e-like protein [Ostreococcus tauri]|uniref:50S ribosomal protein L30e-like protein n=1 Tax=Ostreococcus tauri TaxID=70448 RepID=A0A1Y5I9E2_OSTTA|nr:50S ribosomal protein L30e-like protein [Ostreococcus tauri]
MKTPKSEKREKTPKTPSTPRSPSTPGTAHTASEGMKACSAIATPLADVKTTKKILKTVKRGARDRPRASGDGRDVGGGSTARGDGTVRAWEGEWGARRTSRTRGAILTDDAIVARCAAAKAKQVRRGVKEVVKALKKDVKGFAVIAGDISPIDVITHVPILCEEADVPYVYVHSKEELGAAGMTKRPTSVMLVLKEGAKGSVKMSSEDKKEFDEMYAKCVEKIQAMSK